jgi:hypothetical protein
MMFTAEVIVNDRPWRWAAMTHHIRLIQERYTTNIEDLLKRVRAPPHPSGVSYGYKKRPKRERWKR